METDKNIKENFGGDNIEDIRKLRAIHTGDDLPSRVLKEALILEGSVRNSGIHASAIIIAPKDLTEIVPVATSKETTLLITQYDGKVIEDAGVIKMDFLGLKTLTIVRDALRLIEEHHGIKIDIDTIPLDDSKTFELYQRGETNGTFQFESAGMQKYLKELKPDKFEDLIAMNALYRPGPIEYIPKFILRKHGREKVSYDLEVMQEHLEETYGITVYQEQVMLLSQKLAGFTKGDADTLRKAMGKKQKDVLDKMKSKFIEGTSKRGHDEKVCEKIWKDWEAFASYAFNKSHSTCYAFVAFQTAYLKTHYSAEYMSAVLTHNLSNIDKITFFMEECRRMGIPVLGPDVNESQYNFAVNKKGEIRFGLGAIKGVGEAAVQSIIDERNTNGAFKNIFDLTQRISGKAANKRGLESLAQAGAFDCFTGIHRAQYFATDGKDNVTAIERAVKYGSAYTNQLSSAQHSLFGDAGSATEIPAPVLTACEPWSKLEELKKEKEVIGFYISGHPLDGFKFEIKNFCNVSIEKLNNELDKYRNKEVNFAGIITDVNHRMSKAGKPFGSFNIEDFSSSMQITLFGEDYGKLKQFLNPESIVYIKGKVSSRYNSPDDWEFRANSIQFLSDVSDKMTKQLNVKMKLYDVSRNNISRLQELLDVNKGTVPVRMQIVDEEKNWSIPLISKVHRVKVNSQLVDEMKEVMNVEVSIN